MLYDSYKFHKDFDSTTDEEFMRLPVDLGKRRFDADILSGLLSGNDKKVEILEFQRDILSQDNQE